MSRERHRYVPKACAAEEDFPPPQSFRKLVLRTYLEMANTHLFLKWPTRARHALMFNRIFVRSTALFFLHRELQGSRTCRLGLANLCWVFTKVVLTKQVCSAAVLPGGGSAPPERTPEPSGFRTCRLGKAPMSFHQGHFDETSVLVPRRFFSSGGSAPPEKNLRRVPGSVLFRDEDAVLDIRVPSIENTSGKSKHSGA